MSYTSGDLWGESGGVREIWILAPIALGPSVKDASPGRWWDPGKLSQGGQRSNPFHLAKGREY